MPMYILMEYSKNYSKTTGSLWNYYRDEPNNPPLNYDPLTINYNADPITNSASFKYKSSITGKTLKNNDDNVKNNNRRKNKDAKIVVPLKHLSNFWRNLDMPLINCEISLTLTWSEDCVLTDIITHVTVPVQGDNPARPAINAPTNASLKITDTELYVPVVTLSTENDKLLEHLKTGFKRTIKQNKYRSEVTNYTKNDNLNYLIDPTFNKINRPFALSFKNEDDRTSFSNYYVPNIQIKNFNVLIDGQSFFESFYRIQNKKEKYEQTIEMGRNNDYTTGNLLDYEHFSKYYRLIAIDLSKQIKLENPNLKQQINFIGRLDKDNGARFSSLKNEKEQF